MWKRWTEVVTGIRERSGKSGTLVLLQKLLRVLPMTEELTEPPVKRQCTDGPLTRECASTLAVSREGSSGDLLTPTEPTHEEPFQRIRRKKCALLISYNGRGYLGMQLNPGTKTIERDLLEALAKAEAFPADMKSDLGKLQFQRCSRTDKGVSAARQVVSIKHMAPEKEVVVLANTFLPPQIKIMGLRRATKMFNSKTACSSRTYEYLMPTYAFAPYAWTTLDYKIDDGTREKVARLLKMYEKSHNFHNFTSGKKFEEDSAMRYIISFTCGAPFLTSVSTKGHIAEESSLEAVEGRKSESSELERNGRDSHTEHSTEMDTELSTETQEERVSKPTNSSTTTSDVMTVKLETECSSEGDGAEEDSRKCKKVEFITLQVKGQSFMIHQIRKMVGLVIAIVRGFALETVLVEAFQRDKVDIPRAPALGLLLENVFFDRYNKKFGNDGSHEPLEWEECVESVEGFKRRHIHQSIIDTEIEEMSMMHWLGSLQIHNFYSTKQRLSNPQPTVETPCTEKAELSLDNEKTKTEVADVQ